MTEIPQLCGAPMIEYDSWGFYFLAIMTQQYFEPWDREQPDWFRAWAETSIRIECMAYELTA